MKHSEHLVLRARLPVLRLKRNKAIISALLFEISEKFGVRIYNNFLTSNHIHLLVKAKTQKDLDSSRINPESESLHFAKGEHPTYQTQAKWAGDKRHANFL